MLTASIHPLPPAPPPDGSLEGWIWLIVALVVLVIGGVVLASRH
jgi:hypothetical protein